MTRRTVPWPNVSVNAPPSKSAPAAPSALLIQAETTSARSTAPNRTGSLLLAIGIMLIAFNLRPVFASLSAVLPEVLSSTGLSTAAAGWLTTLPLLCLGLFASLAPKLARRFGAEPTLLLVLLFVALGTGLRGLATVPSLFAGTALAGIGIAVGNVLLPGLVKRDFPARAELMTGLYTMVLCAGAALAAGLTVPIERALTGTWPGALAIWSLPALLAAALWLPQATRAAHAPRTAPAVQGLWRDPLAWQVTLFMGLQSAMAYCILGWLAPIMRARGMGATSAGLVVSATVMAQMVGCLVVPPLAARLRDQRGIAAALAGLAVVAMLGLMFTPLSAAWAWAMLQGFGQGGLFAVALLFIILRAPNPHTAAQLSAMAQGVGYVLAAFAPLLVGVLHDATGSFAATAPLFMLLGLACAASGLGAGRNRHVLTAPAPA